MSDNLENIRPKKVKVMLDKERNLQFDLNAFAEMEDKFGSIEVALDELQNGKLKALRAMLWVGLISEDASLTEKEVGSFIGLANIQEVIGKLNEAITSALPPKEESKGSKKDPKALMKK